PLQAHPHHPRRGARLRRPARQGRADLRRPQGRDGPPAQAGGARPGDRGTARDGAGRRLQRRPDPAPRPPAAGGRSRRRAAQALSGRRPRDKGGRRPQDHRTDYPGPQGGGYRRAAPVRLFWNIAGIEARKRMSYRADFWLNSLVAFVTELGVAYFIVAAMFSGADRLGGYSRNGMLLYYVAIILVARVVRSTDLEWAIADDIYQGALSRYLLYPVSYGVLKYAAQIGALLPAFIQVVLFSTWVPFVLG